VAIGVGTFVNYGVFIDNAAAVTIGERCSLGPNVTILTGSHQIGPGERRAGSIDNKPVRVGDGSWLGAGVTVLPGVSIGKGCVIAAGAIVTKDCESDFLYAGVPARKVRRLP
jgi:maltose O-acetyltransferase